MTQEMKQALFEEALRLESKAQKTNYDGRNYWEQANGAFAMLQILGLGEEYVHWSDAKLYPDFN